MTADLDDRAEGFRTYSRAIDDLARIADPRLLDQATRWERVSMTPAPTPLPQSHREVRTYLVPERFYAGYLGVRGDAEIPYQLRRDLAERVPQALLRDLHRMVYPDIPIEWRPAELGLDPGGREGLREARGAQRRLPLPTIEPIVEALMAEQERQRRLRQDPWEPRLPDDAPREHRAGLYFAE